MYKNLAQNPFGQSANLGVWSIHNSGQYGVERLY